MNILSYDGFDVNPYNDFISECSKKVYGDVGVEVHHIVPVHLGGIDVFENLIILGYKDHYMAHKILANCFPDGHDCKIKNLSASNMILRSAKRFIKANIEYNDVVVGSDEFWEIASREIPKLLSGINNSFYGKKHTETTKEIIRYKRKFQTFTDETRKKLSDSKKIQMKIALESGWNPTPMGDAAKCRRKKHFEDLVPDGIFLCDIMIGSAKYTCYRFCPLCKKILYYGANTKKRSNAIFDERIGRTCRECANNKLKILLLDGAFECDLVINGQRKLFYKYCPKCNTPIYYNSKGGVHRSVREGNKCNLCKRNNK